jgi:hypothetical protein
LIKSLLLIIIFITITTAVWCQVTISGTVFLADDHLPIPGVTVIEKGTTKGTLTKIDGTFLIEVADLNSILIFTDVGMRKQEIAVKGKQQIIVTLKTDCLKDFFDAQVISVYDNCGLLNNPLGAQLVMASPFLRIGVIKGSYSYQTNLAENYFQNGQIELSHYFSNCDFDMDARWNYRQFSINNNLKCSTFSFENDLNLRNIKLIAGYSHLDFNKNESLTGKISSGILIGFGRSFRLPLYPTVTGKVAFYRNNIEYQANIQGGYKRLLVLMKFYKLNSFNEFSIGIGTKFGYRLKSQKR